MEQPMSETVVINRLPLVLAVGAAGLVLAGTIVLWANYGTAVFFEVIRSGLIACFG